MFCYKFDVHESMFLSLFSFIGLAHVNCIQISKRYNVVVVVRHVGYLLHLHAICINKLPAKQRNAARRCAASRDTAQAQRHATQRRAAVRCAVPRSAPLRAV